MSVPPLSRTARLCPLFSSTSSLYIPEVGTARSDGPPEEQGAPRPCEEEPEHHHNLQHQTCITTRSSENTHRHLKEK